MLPIILIALGIFVLFVVFIFATDDINDRKRKRDGVDFSFIDISSDSNNDCGGSSDGGSCE